MAHVGARDRRRVVSFVVVLDDATERWALEPVDWMNGCRFVPFVVGPSIFPIVEDPALARREPELVLASLIVHASRVDEARAKRIGEAWLASLGTLESARREWYLDVAQAQLERQNRRKWMELLMQPPPNYQFQSEFMKNLRDQGLREGELSILLRQIERRFGPLDEATRERLQAATRAELARIADRILDARTLEALFADASSPS